MKKWIFMTMVLLVMAADKAPAMEEPWSVNGNSPVIDSGFKEKKISVNDMPGANPFISLIRGFQDYISPVDGERCNMYPTCSAYGLNALRKHGTLKGIVLTADRLLHEYDEPSFAPRIIIFGSLRYYDPVEYNDFWWSK